MPSQILTLPNNNPPGPFINGVPNVGTWPFTAAEMLSIGTNPITLLPGLAGYTYFVHVGVFYKSAGTAFVIGGGGSHSIQYTNSAFTVLASVGVAGTLDQTIEESFIYAVTLTPLLSNDESTHIGGKGVRLTTSNGVNYTSGGSSCNLTLVYYILPTKISSIPNI